MGAVQISQLVDEQTKKNLDKITNMLEGYAMEKGKRAPKKGEVLSYLLDRGALGLTSEEYFKNK